MLRKDTGRQLKNKEVLQAAKNPDLFKDKIAGFSSTNILELIDTRREIHGLFVEKKLDEKVYFELITLYNEKMISLLQENPSFFSNFIKDLSEDKILALMGIKEEADKCFTEGQIDEKQHLEIETLYNERLVGFQNRYFAILLEKFKKDSNYADLYTSGYVVDASIKEFEYLREDQRSNVLEAAKRYATKSAKNKVE